MGHRVDLEQRPLIGVILLVAVYLGDPCLQRPALRGYVTQGET